MPALEVEGPLAVSAQLASDYCYLGSQPPCPPPPRFRGALDDSYGPVCVRRRDMRSDRRSTHREVGGP
ncbi:hypothetical protein M407DRAFT_241863 [Tulasnella calospora MUT 4182]|uniref:Uncharacterized protein n=1 Tax=Tulasnella calospora MUT 4182 TaxID=1051891 RepID=A0A0C3QTA2_9AGAM|nr:hypothetical protein M407DRAFT_241863 [Tulasnella calospora MUT 4182]